MTHSYSWYFLAANIAEMAAAGAAGCAEECSTLDSCCCRAANNTERAAAGDIAVAVEGLDPVHCCCLAANNAEIAAAGEVAGVALRVG